MTSKEIKKYFIESTTKCFRAGSYGRKKLPKSMIVHEPVLCVDTGGITHNKHIMRIIIDNNHIRRVAVA